MGTVFLVGERSKRARRYLLMSMESRDIIVIPYCLGISGGLSVIYPCFSADIPLFLA